MKKILVSLTILALIMSFGFSKNNSVSAETQIVKSHSISKEYVKKNALQNKSLPPAIIKKNKATKMSDIPSTFDEVKTTQGLNELLKKKGLISLDKNGLITIQVDLNSLGINKNISEEYMQMVNIMNQQIQDDVISLDQNLNVKPFTVEKVAEKVYQKNKENKELEPNLLSTMALYKDLDLVGMMKRNRKELEDIFNTQITFNPSGAYNFTVGWWVGLVRPGGDWDYKVVPGYAPWYTNFSVHNFYGTVEVQNSKWIGNYNYGFTGQFLFPLDILLKGGDAVSYLLNWEPDTPDVKLCIEGAYADAYYFWENPMP